MFGCDLQGFGHLGGWFSGAIFLLAGALITYLVLRCARKSPLSADRTDSLKILKMRLARGDISLEEYNTLKTVL